MIPVADVNALCQMWPDFAAKLEAQAEQAQRSVNSFRVRQLQWLCKKANPGTRPANTGAGGGGAVGARRGDASHGGAAEPSATPAAPAAAAEPGAISQQEPSVGPAAGSGVSRSRRWLMQRRVPSFLRLETPVSSRALPTVQASGDAPLPAADGRGSKEDSGGSSEAAEPNQGPGEQTSQADAGNGAGGSAPENNGEEGGGDHTSARRSRLRSAAARSLRRAQSVGASFVVRGGLNGRSIASSVPGARSSLDRSYSFRNVLQTPATSRRNRCMLRPQQPSKVAWDLWVAVLIIYSTLTVPFRLAFGKSGVRIWVVLDTATDLCFFLDIVANFHTAYTDAQGALVWDKSRVAARYLRTWFLLDLVSTLPFDWLVISTAQGGADQGVALRSTKLLRVLRLARLLKLARVLKLSKIPGVHEDTVAISPAVLRLVRLLLSIAFVAHLNGCLWFGVADAGNSTSWVNACCADASTVGGHGPRCIADLHTAEQYLASVFWALTTCASRSPTPERGGGRGRRGGVLPMPPSPPHADPRPPPLATGKPQWATGTSPPPCRAQQSSGSPSFQFSWAPSFSRTWWAP